MRTSKIEASRGYGGCRHASISHSRLMGRRTYRGYKSRGSSRTTLRTSVLCSILLVFTLISMHVTSTEYQQEKSQLTSSMKYEVHNDTAILPVLKSSPIMYSQPKSSVSIMNVSTSSMEPMIDTVDDTPAIVELDVETMVNNSLGANTINIENNTLMKYELPNVYYPGIDFSSFQPYMDYRCITNTSSPAYKISHSELSYSDEYGMRRFRTNNDQFTINGQDDYVIALGTFYKEKGTAGSRYLIVTTTGSYTAITGDEKSDAHTDSRHMFSMHSDGGCAGIIEWIVDQRNLEYNMKMAGTITAGPIEVTQGEILYIYGIQ